MKMSFRCVVGTAVLCQVHIGNKMFEDIAYVLHIMICDRFIDHEKFDKPVQQYYNKSSFLRKEQDPCSIMMLFVVM